MLPISSNIFGGAQIVLLFTLVYSKPLDIVSCLTFSESGSVVEYRVSQYKTNSTREATTYRSFARLCYLSFTMLSFVAQLLVLRASSLLTNTVVLYGCYISRVSFVVVRDTVVQLLAITAGTSI